MRAPALNDPFLYRHPITGEPTDRHGAPLSSEQKGRLLKQAENEWLRKMDQYHGVIKSLDELSGFTITGLTRYKPGVVRYVAVKGNESRTGIARDEVFAAVQIPE